MQKKVKVEIAFGRKYPEQVVLVTTRKPDGGANVMAVGWVAIVSDEPWMFALGIDAGAYTHKLIKATGEFVVAYPSAEMVHATMVAGTVHGSNRDKIAESGLVVQKAVSVAAPLLADAVANFECRLKRIYKPGNCPVIVGQVVAAHVNADPKVRRLYTVGPNYALAGVVPQPQKHPARRKRLSR